MKQDKSEQKTVRIAEYLEQAKYKNLPREVIEATKTVILDTIGVMINASKYQAPRLAVEFIESLGGRRESTVIGNKAKNSTVNAAFANGVMGHDIELDDSHAPSKTHPAAVIIPAALAIGEKEKRSGKDLILAIVSGYDIESRISVALGPGWHLARNFHPTCVCGCFGAAVAAGKILHLKKDQFINVLGLSGCQASGLESWQNEIGHMTKSFHTGIAARNGLVAALLAKRGYNGPPGIFDGQYSVFDAFSAGKHNLEDLIDGLGTRYEIMNTGFKIYSSCRITHAPLDAFFMIMRKNNLTHADIREATVRVPTGAVSTIDANELLTHNMQYVLAVAAVKGIVTSDQFHKKSTDRRILDLAKRVKLIAEPKLDATLATKRSGVVNLVTTSGKEYEQWVDDAAGEPGNPLSREQFEEKFTNLAVQVLPKGRVEKILETISRLEKLENVGNLMRLCAH